MSASLFLSQYSSLCVIFFSLCFGISLYFLLWTGSTFLTLLVNVRPLTIKLGFIFSSVLTVPADRKQAAECLNLSAVWSRTATGWSPVKMAWYTLRNVIVLFLCDINLNYYFSVKREIDTKIIYWALIIICNISMFLNRNAHLLFTVMHIIRDLLQTKNPAHYYLKYCDTV